MHKKNISFSIPLSGSTLESSNLLLNDLEKKFSIKFIKNKKSRLHINLFSGSTENLDEIVSFIKKNLDFNYDLNLKLLGFGAFLTAYPTIFIRFENTNFFSHLRKIFFKTSDLWNTIEETVKRKLWIPKCTLVHKDMDTKFMNDVVNFLNLQSLPPMMKIEEISILDFSKDEIEIDSFFLNKILK